MRLAIFPDEIFRWDLGNFLEAIFFLAVENFREGIFAIVIFLWLRGWGLSSWRGIKGLTTLDAAKC